MNANIKQYDKLHARNRFKYHRINLNYIFKKFFYDTVETFDNFYETFEKTLL